MSRGSVGRDLDWLLESLSRTVVGVRHVIVLSPDGLTLGRSPGLSDHDAGRLAALAAGAQSLGRSAGQKFGCGEVRQTIIEMEAALLFITPALRGTCLALLAAPGADAGQIAYEMAVLVKRVGQHIIANPRFPVPETALPPDALSRHLHASPAVQHGRRDAGPAEKTGLSRSARGPGCSGRFSLSDSCHSLQLSGLRNDVRAGATCRMRPAHRDRQARRADEPGGHRPRGASTGSAGRRFGM